METKIVRRFSKGYSGKGIPNRWHLVAETRDEQGSLLATHELAVVASAVYLDRGRDGRSASCVIHMAGFGPPDIPEITLQQTEAMQALAEAGAKIGPYLRNPGLAISTKLREWHLTPNFYPAAANRRREAEDELWAAIAAVRAAFKE